MRLLAVDTASEACSAALMLDEAISERLVLTQREHGPQLLAMIDELLAEGGVELRSLDAIAFGCGPGSFTGLRIAAGITQGLAFGADVPVIPVSDLAMLAQGLMDEHGAAAAAVCLDARMGEAYVGFYRRGEAGLAVAAGDDALLAPGSIELPAGADDWMATGPGWNAFDGLAERLGICLEESESPRLPAARYALRLAEPALKAGNVLAADAAQPVYLREKVAWQK